MLTFATLFAVLILPLTGLMAVLLVVAWLERARDASIARQVALTDAIHRELGAVVAPVVKRRLGGGWRAEIAVPLESPSIVARVVAIAHAAMLRSDAGRPLEIVLTAQEPGVRQANVQKLQPAAAWPLAASEREVVAWTGTSTSRAS